MIWLLVVKHTPSLILIIFTIWFSEGGLRILMNGILFLLCKPLTDELIGRLERRQESKLSFVEAELLVLIMIL